MVLEFGNILEFNNMQMNLIVFNHSNIVLMVLINRRMFFPKSERLKSVLKASR